MSDVPTQRFDAAPTPPEEPPVQKKSRGLLIALIVVGGVLVLAIIVVLVLLLANRGGGTALPSTSATASATSVTPTPTFSDPTISTPTPAHSTGGSAGGGGTTQPTGGAFTTFSPVTQVRCEFAAPNFTPPPVPIAIKWATVRADSVWIVQGTGDAADSGFMQIPVNGDQSNFTYEIDFPCYQTSAVFTLTLVGSDGQHVSKSWTVTNTGDHS